MRQSKPIVFFDLETTGTDVARDRIVEIYCKKVLSEHWGDQPAEEEFHMYFNPGFQMRPDVIAIHGITNEFVSDKPMFRSKAESIRSFIAGCDLAGYNIKGFDIPVLAEEFLRCGIELDLSEVRVIDIYQVHARIWPRDLKSVFKQYSGVEYADAHTASADVNATISVLSFQMARHPDKFDDIAGNDLAEKLVNFTADDVQYADYDRKLYWNVDGELCFAFGKAKDRHVKDDLGFADWMLNQSFITLTTKNIIKKYLNHGKSI